MRLEKIIKQSTLYIQPVFVIKRTFLMWNEGGWTGFISHSNVLLERFHVMKKYTGIAIEIVAYGLILPPITFV